MDKSTAAAYTIFSWVILLSSIGISYNKTIDAGVPFDVVINRIIIGPVVIMILGLVVMSLFIAKYSWEWHVASASISMSFIITGVFIWVIANDLILIFVP